MSIFKKIFSHSIIYTAGPQLPKVLGLFLLPVLTPHLSSVDFGIWGTIMAYTLFFSSARDLGMIAPMINTFYKNESRWKIAWRQIFFYLLIWGVPFTILQLIVIYFIAPIEARSSLPILLTLIGIQTLVLDVPIILGTRYYQLSEKPTYISVISFISGCISVSLQYYYIAILKQGYYGWFYALFFSSLFSFFAYCISLYLNQLTPIFKFRIRHFKPRLKLALPMIPHNYSAYLLNASDRVVMNFYKVNTGQIGLFNVAYMWGNYMEILGNSIGMAVGPIYLKIFAERDSKSDEKAMYLTFFLQSLFLGGSFLIALWSKELFRVFIKNDSLQTAYPLAIIIIMSYCYRPMYWAVVNKLQYFELTGQLWKISFIGGAINVILNIIFIPIWGYQAAAFTTFFALLYIGFSGFFLKSFMAINKHDYLIARWLIMIIVLTLLAYLFKDLSILLKLLISLSVFSLVIIVSVKFIKAVN